MEYEIKITGSGTLQQLKDALVAIAANIDTNEDYSDGYEDEGPYLMTEISNYSEDEENEKDENDGWVCTDPDSNQWRRKISDRVWEFKEDRFSFSHSTKIYNSLINLDKYSLADMQNDCSAFGYAKDDVKQWWDDSENLELIAVCIFELEN